MNPELRVSVVGEDGPERLEAAADALREELLELDVGSVRRMTTGPAPTDARGIDLAALGGLIVSLPAAPELFATVVDVVRRWLTRSKARSVRIEIDGDLLELSQVSEQDQTRLVDAWLQRRTTGDA